MKKTLLVPLAIIVLLIIGALFFTYKKTSPNPIPSPSATTKPSQTVSQSSPSQLPISISPTNKREITIKVALIALNQGGTVGCGDSVQLVQKTIPYTTETLKAALNELLAIRTQYYRQSGLYNSLYQSNLSVSSVTIKDGTATMYLSGQLQLGGVCDNPRVKAQLEQTALQFSSVKKAVIFINNKPIDEVLSEK